MEGERSAGVLGQERSQRGLVCASLSALLPQVGTVIVSNLHHRVDTELAQSTFKLDCVQAHLPKEEGAPGVKCRVPVERQQDRHPALPTGRHQSDCVSPELKGQVVPAPIVHVEVEGHREPGPQVDDHLAGEELQAQLQLVLPAADGEEEGMVHPLGAEAQHQRQLCAQGGRNDGTRGSLEPGPLRKDEARLERNDSRGCRVPGLRPAEAQPLEDVHIFRSSLGGGQVTGKRD
ncbi:hypothetical protein P7K49_014452 [Saguinus oedipus]|uniref:Uncharacterized protein n=1 Tax=Saguinus oedipus TaxID=9490 RepID=A0ABQ9VJ68_SAGOE|nr:hypothetical protein P7K49_014452 [Saguinus oedipus]